VVGRRRVVGGDGGAGRRRVVGGATARGVTVGRLMMVDRVADWLVAVGQLVVVGWVVVVAGRAAALTVGSRGSLVNVAADGAAFWTEDVGLEVGWVIAPSQSSRTTALAK
jgi:hypothetical protein